MNKKEEKEIEEMIEAGDNEGGEYACAYYLQAIAKMMFDKLKREKK